MPVVNTTNSFSNNEQITSTKLNDIMDNSFFISGATVSGQGLEVTAGGQMQIKDLDVTTAKIADAGVTQAKLATNVVGTGPAFFAYASVSQSLTDSSTIKVLLGAEDFDTNNNFASSTFTASIAGYYFITGNVYGTTADIALFTAYIYKNGVAFTQGSRATGGTAHTSVSAIVQLSVNDTIELYTRQSSGATKGIGSGRSTNLFGYLVRPI